MELQEAPPSMQLASLEQGSEHAHQALQWPHEANPEGLGLSIN